jgi:5-methylcytosine-specific restriction enzyme subunit McrC
MNLSLIQMKKKNDKRIIDLYEYANQEKFDGDPELLEAFLDDIWKKRPQLPFNYFDISEEDEYDPSISSHQKFITLLKNSNIKSRKYVGIIKYNQFTINLLPKIFYDKNTLDWSEKEIKAIQANILWWLSYCRKIKFPKTKSDLSTIKSNFFEVFIYLFAIYTKEVFSYCLYQSYTEIDNELNFMKGRLNVKRYITDNISKARHHKLSCIYDSFEFDNPFNRIIKSVANILIGTTENNENKQLLSEIIFILDEVSDIKAKYSDCEKVKLNPLYEDMLTVLDYCKLFLANSLTFSYKNQFRVFAFLLPMEYVFEDFIFGFMEKHLNDIQGIENLRFQKSDLYLAKLHENNVFNLQHDIYFEYYGKKIIADTKYKIIDSSKKSSKNKDYKHGVSQSDLYQVISYSIRRKAKDIFLIYPQTLIEQQEGKRDKTITFKITDEFSGVNIDVNVVKVPVINNKFPEIDQLQSLQRNFDHTEKKLKDKLCNVFNINDNIQAF